MSTRATLHQLETLTYNVTEEEKDVLADVNVHLKQILSSFYSKMPHKDGIVLRSHDRNQIINMRRRVWKAKATLRCSSLPSWKRKRQLPYTYRNRFGVRADRLRRANQVIPV